MKPSTARLKEQHIYYIQILFISGVTFGLQTDLEHWPANIARYVLYIITMEATKGISAIMYDMFHEKSTNFMARLDKLDIPVVVNRVMLFLLAFAIVYIKKQTIFSEDFPIVFIAYLIMKHPTLKQHEIGSVNAMPAEALINKTCKHRCFSQKATMRARPKVVIQHCKFGPILSQSEKINPADHVKSRSKNQRLRPKCSQMASPTENDNISLCSAQGEKFDTIMTFMKNNMMMKMDEMQQSMNNMSNNYAELVSRYNCLDRERETYKRCISILEKKIKTFERNLLSTYVEMNMPLTTREKKNCLSYLIENTGSFFNVLTKQHVIKNWAGKKISKSNKAGKLQETYEYCGLNSPRKEYGNQAFRFNGLKGSSKTTISYGAGMACSLYEGYLKHVLPSDGQGFGFEENVRNYESEHGVVFPVKRMFLIITKSYYCPPDLGKFNKGDKKLSYLEAVRSLEKVVKDVAGVKNRAYRNAVYRVYRAGGRGGRPLCVAAECATPLHTLYGVLANKDLADELMNLDVPATVEEFCNTLRHILDKSAAVKDKCELVYFDDTNKNLNLADVLLDRMKEINLDFDDW